MLVAHQKFHSNLPWANELLSEACVSNSFIVSGSPRPGWTHWPLGDVAVFLKKSYFRSPLTDSDHECFLQNYFHVNTAEPIDDKSTLVHLMARCSLATSHYLSQCWPSFMLPYFVTSPQWVNNTLCKWSLKPGILFHVLTTCIKTLSQKINGTCPLVVFVETSFLVPPRPHQVPTTYFRYCMVPVIVNEIYRVPIDEIYGIQTSPELLW